MAERFDNDAGTITKVKPEKKLKRPRLYRVLLHNDDYTTREFVVYVLQAVFHLGEQDSIRVMLHVHHNSQMIRAPSARVPREWPSWRSPTTWVMAYT